MPNLNVKGESSRPSAGEGTGGGGGIPKVVLIVLIAIVAVGGFLFVLNTTGVVKLWGKKKPAHAVVNIPAQTPPPVKDTVKTKPAKVMKAADTASAMQKNLAKLESKSTDKGTMVMGTGDYTIQLSSWLSKENADAQAATFSNAGFDAFVSHRGGYFTVNVGRFESRKKAKAKAESMAHMLESMYVIAKVGN